MSQWTHLESHLPSTFFGWEIYPSKIFKVEVESSQHSPWVPLADGQRSVAHGRAVRFSPAKSGTGKHLPETKITWEVLRIDV